MLKLADLDSNNLKIKNCIKKYLAERYGRKRNLLSSCSKMGAIGGIKIETIFQTTNYGKR